MNLKQLTYILAIAEEKNISRAAERLFVSQSTLSIYLKKLEKELGTPLFLRTGHQLVLTPAGEDYVETAKRILESKEQLFQKLAEMSGKKIVRIGIASKFIFSVFSEVLSEESFLNIRASIQESRSPALFNMLQKKQIDTAIIATDEIPVAEGISVNLLKTERMLIAVPPGRSASAFASMDYDDPPILEKMDLLKDQQWALFPPDTYDYKIADRIFKAYDLNAEVKYELYNTRSICQMVLAGNCFTAVPEYTLPRDMGLLVCRPPKDYCRYQSMLQREGYHSSKEERHLLDRFIERYQHYYD